MSLNRVLSGEPLVLNLHDEAATARAEHKDKRNGRIARTLIKDGPLRVTLISLEAGSAIPEHSAEGPITVHVLNGTIRFTTANAVHDLAAGTILALAGGARHSVAAEGEATFLLTVSLPHREA
jgi:quercetin dioxygenase-like cupin family protein